MAKISLNISIELSFAYLLLCISETFFYQKTLSNEHKLIFELKSLYVFQVIRQVIR